MMSDTRLRARLRPPPELDTADGFRALIGRRLLEQQRSARRHRIVAGFALAACAALGLLLVARPSDIARSRPRPTPPSLASVARLDTLRAGDGPETRSLADGTVLTLSAHAQLTTTSASYRRVSARLDAGEVVFDLEPVVDRRWDVDAHIVQLQAVDARFAVDRTDQAVRVRVMRGTVLVYAAHLPQGQTRMTEGQTMHFQADSEPPTAPAPTEPQTPSSPHPQTTSTDRKVAGTQATSASAIRTANVDRQAVRAADDEKAADDLLASADWARQNHDVDAAIASFSRFIERYPSDRRVGLAAFTLGKLTLRNDPARAASSFQLALDRGVPAMMAEGVYARLVEALAKSGDIEAAKRARQRYDATYPHGAHRDEVAQWAP